MIRNAFTAFAVFAAVVCTWTFHGCICFARHKLPPSPDYELVKILQASIPSRRRLFAMKQSGTCKTLESELRHSSWTRHCPHRRKGGNTHKWPFIKRNRGRIQWTTRSCWMESPMFCAVLLFCLCRKPMLWDDFLDSFSRYLPDARI